MKACHECIGTNGTNGMINVRGIGLMIGIEFDSKKEEIRKSLIIQELAPTITRRLWITILCIYWL
jgi:4-aminobutyrate aminotransferase-like enzyme